MTLFYDTRGGMICPPPPSPFSSGQIGLKELLLLLIAHQLSLREMCPYSKFSWSVFYRIPTEYGEMRSSIKMRENTYQKNSEHENTDTFHAVF